MQCNPPEESNRTICMYGYPLRLDYINLFSKTTEQIDMFKLVSSLFVIRDIDMLHEERLKRHMDVGVVSCYVSQCKNVGEIYS